jgi:hypothetical protein
METNNRVIPETDINVFYGPRHYYCLKSEVTAAISAVIRIIHSWND